MLNFPNVHNTRSSNNNNGSRESRKSQSKNMFVLGKLRGFGCKGMAMPVSAAVQSAAVRQQAQTRRKRSPRRPINLADTPDICCAPPGISYLSDVVPMPNMNAQRTDQVQCFSFLVFRKHSRMARRSANNSDIRSSESRQSHHLYIRFTEGILDDEDQYRGWRQNLDSMLYQDLLDLGDKVGYVNRGLCEKEILHCLKIPKLSVAESVALFLSTDKDWRCCICQEGCRSDKEVGQLGCGHFHHISCIKQWLRQKNECPVCKIPPIPHKAKSSLY